MPDRDAPDESFAALFESSKKAQSPRRRPFEVGAEADVVVVSLGKESVFVELDGKQEGFVEAKDLRNAKGELTVKVGSRIRARVAEVGGRAGAVRLVPVFVRPPVSEGDEVVAAQAGAAGGPALVVGARVKGAVTSVERYGVFVSIAGTGTAEAQGQRPTRGLLPLAESGLPRGADPHKHLPVGTPVEAKIIAIDERGRIRLSVTQLSADEERKAFESYANKPDASSSSASPRGFGTLGDLLNKKR